MNYSTAKAIIRLSKIEGRTFKKKHRDLKKKSQIKIQIDDSQIRNYLRAYAEDQKEMIEVLNQFLNFQDKF